MAKRSGSGLEIFDPSFSLGQLTQLTGFHLRRASLLDFSTFSNTTGDLAITPLRYSVLEVVGANPNLRQVELAAILGLSKPAATIAVDFWQKRGCMIRRQSKDDGRARGLVLSAKGLEVLESLRLAVAEHDRALTDALCDEELTMLHALLAKIVTREKR